ncbi:hypothetical protein NQ317_018595 [Molorchus minor]|uniref:Catalase n=1 Tax=Molorchus minor TaxID=1323400 RepID=A0ABQ9JJH2_9CUCU|nr:hypothetical protein NQ317_018595 [Molorchus minor]
MATTPRDAAANQLLQFSKEHEGKIESTTTTFGTGVPEKDASMTVGYHGPILLQDWVLIDELSHFSRERIPERVVHAKGAGAFGYFIVTNDITQYTAASVFSEVNKKTSIAVRFSQVAGEMGYPDTYRDVRGFAIKFYAEDGIWDLVGNNLPVFFVKDCALFPSFIHAVKRNPKTHLRPDYDMFWDFITLREETTHTTMMMFSDRGIPANYRQMHGYGVNTFVLVNAKKQVHYCKFHYITNQGIDYLTSDDAQKIGGVDPDYHIRDLYNAIETKNFPSWNFYIQIMTPEQAGKYRFDPFDDSKVWLHADFPLIPVGKLVLNKNPKNYFAEVEQIAFDPAHLIPGIEPSFDRMIQGRLFNYGDTHRYRLGANSGQLAINSPPDYTATPETGPSAHPSVSITGPIERTDSGNDDNFTQSRLLYRNVLKPEERGRLIQNIVSWLKPTNSVLQQRAIDLFSKVDESLGQKIRETLNESLTQHVVL